jgi:glycine hydroxymethyltransferase
MPLESWLKGANELQNLQAHLKEADPTVWNIVQRVRQIRSRRSTLANLGQEKIRQQHFINLIPSENFTTQAVLDALGSPMQSEYN